MKKRIITVSVIVVLAAGYTAASWYTGNVIENKIDDKLKQFSKKLNNNNNLFETSITYQDYQKGIFSTSLHLKITATSDDKDRRSIFDDVVTIYHGPLPWSEIKSANFLPKMAAINYQTTKESDENLWAAAGNKPFMTVNSTIDYSENINIAVSNVPINYSDAQKGISWQTSADTLSISSNKQLNNMDIKSKVVQFSYQDEAENINISMQNLILSGQVSSKDDLSYQITHDIAIDHLVIGKQQYHGDETADNSANQLKVDQLKISSNSVEKNSTISGKLSTSIDAIMFNHQNLGKGEVLASYNVVAQNDSSTDSTAPIIVKSSSIKLDKLLWQTAHGNLNADFAINIGGDSLVYNQLTEDNLLFAKANVKLPFKSLSYLLAQISNSDKSLPNEDDINRADQYVVFFSSLFLMKSPIIDVHYDPQDDIEDGIYIDLYYSKAEQRAKLKGQEMTLGQFWHAVSKNQLPNF